MKILLIGLGGFFGAVSRYLVSEGAARAFGDKLPYGTFIVNVVGSFLLGVLFVLSIEKMAVSENLRFLLAVGFLGAFTTFSTFSVDALYLLKSQAYVSFAGYVLGSVLLGILAAFAGMFLAKTMGG